MTIKNEAYIPVWKIAKELNLDRSNLLKAIKSRKYGLIELRFVRDRDKQNQKVIAISKKDYELIKKHRTEDGFLENNMVKSQTNKGFFYIIQTNPNKIPLRYKFGFTNDLDNRIRSFKSVCPNMKVIDKFECNNFHELTLLKMVAGYGRRIGQELYEIEKIDMVIKDIKEVLKKLLPKN